MAYSVDIVEIDQLDYLLTICILESHSLDKFSTLNDIVNIIENCPPNLLLSPEELTILLSYDPYDLSFLDNFLDSFLNYLTQYSLGDVFSLNSITHLLALRIYSIAKRNYFEEITISASSINEILLRELL